MKSVAEFVHGGISTLADLKDALQTAMQLDFSTIPPYLCALWSIDTDPSGVAGMIQSVIIEEMMHFALAGNMLSAIGGTPNIANAAFVPHYPTHDLPGGIHLKDAVDLKPLSQHQLTVFMEIEKPHFRPVARAARVPKLVTIGAFYEEIADGFIKVQPAISSAANYVAINEMAPPYPPIPNPQGGRVLTIADALAAIARIQQEGEGTPGSPDQPADDVAAGQTFAHYYTYMEIARGKALQQVNGRWSFSGPAIAFPTVCNFESSALQPDTSAEFRQAFANLLTALQACWTAGTRPDIAAMSKLRTVGKRLIQSGVRPEFLWP
jgi:hypothetical protein